MLYFPRSSKHRTRQLIVLNVVEAGPTMLKLGVLLRIKSATLAKNMAIMRGDVEAVIRVSLLGKVEHLEKETGRKDVETSSSRELSTE